MTLTSGQKFAHYEIVEPVGKGGMGEVYKATDTRLDRTVAIKVLPSHLAGDDGLRKRFEQEARAVSSLNHPNICTLHDVGSEDGVDFIVMEYLEGETLADRLSKGALPFDQALRYGAEIAGALHDAHRHGIVHRDLKPGNVMLTKPGSKLLDFGLAKPSSAERDATSDDSNAATEAKPLTEEGTILGTFQYMAPEQLEGKEADARTDIFAFGAVLYEMLTGRNAFSGDSQASLISAIMSSEPQPPSELSPLSPPALDRLVTQCLSKAPDVRMQSAHDVVLQLQSIQDANALVATRTPQRSSVGWLAAMFGAAAVTALVVSNLDSTDTVIERGPKQLSLELPGGNLLWERSLALSPDGSGLVFSGTVAGVSQLFRRPWNALEAEPIRGTQGATAPFFSPDGTWLGFFAGDQLKKIQMSGGPAIVVGDAPRASSATWGAGDMIVFSSNGSPLQQVPAAGGASRPITTLHEEDGVLEHLDPSVLPNGKAVLFTVRSQFGTNSQIGLLEIATGEQRLLVPGIGPTYSPSGHLLYAPGFDGTVLAVRFDADRLELAGEPFPVLEGVQLSPWGRPDIGVDSDGTLVYVPNMRRPTFLVWVDREGRQTALTDERAVYRYPRLAPDGSRAAVSIESEGNLDVWVYDDSRGTRTRLTRGGFNAYPVWTPDGERIAFFDAVDMYWVPSDGSGEPERLLQQEGVELPLSWSPDGQSVAYVEDGSDIWLWPVGGEPQPLFDSRARERSPAFSPDGRWLAYVSDESGRDEVYVVPYPSANRKWTVSTDGGLAPLWSPRLPELYYRYEDRVMVVEVEADPAFSAGPPEVLFEGNFSPPSTGGNPYYDVSPDGQRFLMLADHAELNVRVVVNWFEELERLDPTR